jgi:superfamily II DNA or RNA helicase
MTPKYKVGDEVQCVSDPSLIGTIVEVSEFHAGIQWYRVNFGPAGRPKKAEIDLRPYIPAATPADNLLNGNIDGYQEFQRLLTYQRLLRDHPLRNNIYAFNASRTRFYPYQFKPLLKFLDSPKHRLLIADEVGLGKTIEAGLILTELRARQTVQRVLVVCPANLCHKWKLELKRRFGEEFHILSAREFAEFLQEYEDSPQETALNGVISLESIRQEPILEQLDALAPNFDLAIVDEAHHMRNFGRKQRRAGVLLARSADAMLHLTATPIHLGNENLFSLLNILDDEEFPDLFTVDSRFRENEPIVRTQVCLGYIPPSIDEAIDLLRQLNRSERVQTHPAYRGLLEILEEIVSGGGYSPQQRRLLLQAQRNLAELNLLGHIFTRTRKREVQTKLAVRKAYPIRLAFTELEKQFYNAVTVYVRAESEKHTDSPLIQKWMLNTPQRRMASSIPAMVKYYKENVGLNGQDSSEDSGVKDEDFDELSMTEVDLDSPRKNLQRIIEEWPKPGPDSKYDKLREILEGLRKNESPLKIMIFAFFKDTLRYLKRRLMHDGFTCDIISGDIAPDDRTKIVDRFREDPKFEILLSSRVGGEGLDFQFCDILFNYDLPWNPMEIEQRIGRLDRIGQESPVIRIYNFWIEGTIEQRILDRLYARIGIFERSIGELEMILGEELSTIERDILSKRLTAEEEEKLLEQKALAIESRLHQLEKLEKNAAQFIGTDQFFDEEVRMIKERRRFITGEQMRRFIVDFLRTNCPKSRLEYDSDTNLGKFFPDDRLRNLLTKYGNIGDVIRFLTPSASGIPITFDSQTAFDNPNSDFINVLHPLTQSIVRHYSEEGKSHSNAHHVILRTENLRPGTYLYFVNRLRVRAARGSNTLEMVIVDQNLNAACDEEAAEVVLGEMVEKGEDSKGPAYEVNLSFAKEASRKATEIFLDRVARIRNQTKRNNDAFVERRLESLRTSYGKNLNVKRSQLEKAIAKKRADRYLRMLRGTIRRLEAELENKERELQNQRSVRVEFDEIAAGILEVIN